MQPSVHLIHFARSDAPLVTPVMCAVRRLWKQKALLKISATTSSGATSMGQIAFSVRAGDQCEVANEALAGKGGPSPERESLSPSDSDEATNIEERKRQVQRWVSKMAGGRRCVAAGVRPCKSCGQGRMP